MKYRRKGGRVPAKRAMRPAKPSNRRVKRRTPDIEGWLEQREREADLREMGYRA